MRVDEALWTRWARHADRSPDREAVIHWMADAPVRRWRWGELVAEAAAAGMVLRDQGVRPGDVCALVIRHDPRFYPLYMGVVALGAIPAVLAYPNARIHPDKFVHGLQGMSRRSGLDWVLTEESLEAVVKPLATAHPSSVKGVLLPLVRPWPATDIRPSASADPHQPCLLQHSSGTTGLQKAVVLSHAAVLGHVSAYAETLAMVESDRIVSWLPLYHDMGMIAAFHMPLALGIPLVQMDPFEWVAAPGLLLEAISQERGTLSWLPNFAYNLLADRVHEDELDGIRLGTMRRFVNCSEPVRAESHRKFLSRFSSVGIRPEMLAACYAMAETTFAATQTRSGVAPRVLALDGADLARGRAVPAAPGAPSREAVSCGPPIRGCTLRVVDEEGRPLEEGRIGEIAIRSEWMFDEYRNNPEDTNRALRDGWYLTGDYGFTVDGEWYVVGRKKDVIIVAGKNLYPEDIEDAVGQVEGVIAGRVIAFGVDDPQAGTEQIHVVAETELAGQPERRALRLAIQRTGMAIDVTIARVHLAPPRWLIKSSAGKPSRKANRERILEGELSRELGP